MSTCSTQNPTNGQPSRTGTPEGQTTPPPATIPPKAATAAGKDYLVGLAVQSIVLQVPNTRLRTQVVAPMNVKGFIPPPDRTGAVLDDPVIGVWATTYRRATRVLSEGSADQSGRWVQVSRLGMPLVNEVVIPLGQKDLFNSSEPTGDLQFAGSVLNPELAGLIPVLYPGVKVPTAVSAGLGLGGREDVATIFLTGIPGVNRPKTVTPSEMLRINTSTPTGFPNGRLLTDDVVDISIRVLAGATAFSPTFNVSPNKDLGDGVNANDKAFSSTFPYLAEPDSGYDS